MKIERSRIKEQPLDKELRTGQESLLSGFESLLGLAEHGSEDGAELLTQCLISILAIFLKTCDKKPELFYAAAEKRSIWPAVEVLDRSTKALHRHYDPDSIRKRVHLGERTGLKYEGKWAGGAVGSRVARILFTIIDGHRRTAPQVTKKLPELVFEESFWETAGKLTSAESALLDAHCGRLPVLNRNKKVLAEWWSVMNPLFVKLFGSDFENRKEFAHYWAGVEKLGLEKPLKYAKDYQQRNEVRRRISKDVQQGLKSIAAKQPAT
jgi:hypothetical protein